MAGVADQYDNDFPQDVGTSGRLRDLEVSDGQRSHAMWVHLGTLIAGFVSGGVLVPVLVAIVLWQIGKDSRFVDDHGREAVNFQISLFVYGLLVIPFAIITCGIGALMWLVIWVLGLVGMIMASMAGHRGEYFRYPACIRFIPSPTGA